jgi:hypothetical protein
LKYSGEILNIPENILSQKIVGIFYISQEISIFREFIDHFKCSCGIQNIFPGWELFPFPSVRGPGTPPGYPAINGIRPLEPA